MCLFFFFFLHYKEYKNDNIDKKSFYDPSDNQKIKEILGGNLQGKNIKLLYSEFEEKCNDGVEIKAIKGEAKIDIILQRYQTDEHQLLNLTNEMKERGVF